MSAVLLCLAKVASSCGFVHGSRAMGLICCIAHDWHASRVPCCTRLDANVSSRDVSMSAR